jgi:hypothetical protein
MHFTQQDCLIRNELHAVLAQDGVESVVGKWQGIQVTLLLFDQYIGRCVYLGDLKHAGISIDPNELADVGEALGGQRRDDTRTPCCILYPVTCVEFEVLEYLVRQRSAEGLGVPFV